MTPELLKSLMTILGPFAIGWAIWVTVSHMKAKNEIDALKLYVAENYAKKELIDKVFAKLDELSGMVNRIEGQLITASKKD
jgi:5,10-methenyltetrahydromethanopterin hydrogenase